MTPDRAILLLTAGLFLIYLELNRPGWIVPGVLGLLASLFSIDALLRDGITGVGTTLCGTAIALLLVGLRRATPPLLAIASTLALILGLYNLVPVRGGLHIFTATLCGLLLGSGTSLLTRIARRARTNKGLD